MPCAVLHTSRAHVRARRAGKAKLFFPTPEIVLGKFGTWFPDLKASTRELIELLYGGGSYTESRTVYHTLSHYLSFERMFVARIGPSIKRQLETQALIASGQATRAEQLSGLMLQIDEANAYELGRAQKAEDARRYEIDKSKESQVGNELENRLGFNDGRAASTASVKINEMQGPIKLKTHTADEFQKVLRALRSENTTMGKAAMKASAALEAWMVFEEVPPISFGEITEALQGIQPIISDASRTLVGFFQVHFSTNECLLLTLTQPQPLP